MIPRRMHKYLLRQMHLPNFGASKFCLLLFIRLGFILELELAQQVDFGEATDKLVLFEIIVFQVSWKSLTLIYTFLWPHKHIRLLLSEVDDNHLTGDGSHPVFGRKTTSVSLKIMPAGDSLRHWYLVVDEQRVFVRSRADLVTGD